MGFKIDVTCRHLEDFSYNITHPEVGERAVVKSNLRHSTSMPRRLRIDRRDSADHTDTLSQRLLELGSGAACYQSPNQR